MANNFGDVQIFSYDDFSKPLQTLKEPKEWVEVMKYSPDAKCLAVGSHDN